MILVVTDTGIIWNHENPFLKKYKDIVIVVCLEGEKVSDEYECFVVPYKTFGLGMDSYGIENRRLRALASMAAELNSRFSYHDDIVFLTDSEPSTLYPYFVLKDIAEYNRKHLVASSPLKIEHWVRRQGYQELTADMSKLDSVLFYDMNQMVDEFKKSTSIMGFYSAVRDELGKMMPCFLNGIHHMHESPCYFDFSSMQYVLLKNGFNDIDSTDTANMDKSSSAVDFPLQREYCTMGIILPPHYPEEGSDIKEAIERPVSRLDGKSICNMLRNQRIQLAKANNIPFESVECPSIGPCAGTCEKCDAESAYLRDEMSKIPEDKRVYPWFDPTEGVKS